MPQKIDFTPISNTPKIDFKPIDFTPAVTTPKAPTSFLGQAWNRVGEIGSGLVSAFKGDAKSQFDTDFRNTINQGKLKDLTAGPKMGGGIGDLLPVESLYDSLKNRNYGAATVDAGMLGASLFGLKGSLPKAVPKPKLGGTVINENTPSLFHGKVETPKPTDFKPAQPQTVMQLPDAKPGLPPYNTSQFGLKLSKDNSNPLLSHVPNRLRPPSTNAAVFDALLPDSMKVNAQGAALPPTSSIDRVAPKTLTLQNPVIKMQAKEAASNTNTLSTVIEEALDRGNPIVKQNTMDFIKANVSAFSKQAKKLYITAGTELKSMGDAGVELARKGNRFTHQERFNLKEWAEPYKNAILKLSKDERNNFGDYVEGNRPIPNPHVQNAVDIWKKSANEAGTSAETSGMMLETSKGVKVPFKKLSDNYWPHRLKQADIDALPSRIDELMMDEVDKTGKVIRKGMTRSEAELVAKNARNFGELILPQQHQRLHRKFDYDKSAISGLSHLESMSKATARTKEFGRLDVSGKGDLGIADLIEKSSDPERAMKIMKRVVGRDEKVNADLDTAVRVARTAVSWARLQNYGLSSIVGNQLPNMLRGNARQYIGSLGTFLGKNKAITDKSAAMIDISHGVLEQTKKLNPMKFYGGQYTENIVRGQAAGIGEGLAKTYFRELKQNPLNADARKQLSELILEDVDSVLGQAGLSSDQIRMAAARNAELSQGLTTPLNLPLFASKPISHAGDAMLQLAMIFKKQAMIQSKVIKDAMVRNPIKTTALLAGYSQLAGGVIGGAKSTIQGVTKGLVNGEDIADSISNEYENRANYVGRFTGSDNELLNRSIDRALQSWSFGLYTDLLQLALDKNSMPEFAAGPVAGMGGDLFGNMFNPTQLGREALRMLPIPGGVGSGLQKALLPTEAQR